MAASHSLASIATTASRSVVQSHVPFVQRPTCTIAEACSATGLGKTKLYELIGQGQIDTTTIGRRRLVRVSSLLNLLGTESAVATGQ